MSHRAIRTRSERVELDCTCRCAHNIFFTIFVLRWTSERIIFCIFQAFVAVGDFNGHVGLGVKCSKEVATAIRGAINLAKLSIIPIRRGYWGNKIGKPHTVPCKVSFELYELRIN